MHLVSCEHPKVIYNPYLEDYVSVPCRKCKTCRNNYRYQWQKRLEMEMACHPYTVFFTLTYNDDNVPLLVHDGDFLVSKDIKRSYLRGRYHVETEIIQNDNIKIDVPSLDLSEEEKSYVDSRDEFPYVRSKDIQDFMKRFRYYVFKELGSYEKIQYFICSEYGPSTFRSHYHGLFFFDSEKLSKAFDKVLHQSWRCGFVNWSFAQQKCAGYVAKYVNSVIDLPKIYEVKTLRPFFLCSKRPIIGSRSYSTKTLEQIVLETITKFSVYDAKKRAFNDVPLLRSLESKYFGKCQGFSRIVHSDRVALYEVGRRFFTQTKTSSYDFKTFEYWFKVNYFPVFFHRSYSLNVDGLTPYNFDDSRVPRVVNIMYQLGYFTKGLNGDFPALKGYFYMLRSFEKIRYILNLSVEDYVTKIENYYLKKNYENLIEQLKFEHDFCKKNDARYLINLDLALKHKAFTVNYWHGDDKITDSLSSLGLNSEKYTFANGCPNLDVLKNFDFKATSDYVEMVGRNEVIHYDSVKNKRKNDALNYSIKQNLISYE